MNRRIALFTLTAFLLGMNFSTNASCSSWFEKNVIKKDLDVRSFCVSYITSLLLSGGVGIATGGLTAYAENVIVDFMKRNLPQEIAPLFWFLPFFTWKLESEIRNEIITGIQMDLDTYQMEYKKQLMFKSACLASWISYLKKSFIFANV